MKLWTYEIKFKRFVDGLFGTLSISVDFNGENVAEANIYHSGIELLMGD